jgi:D-glycero-alpha-D-manno-heptose-7-phosphate kinase
LSLADLPSQTGIGSSSSFIVGLLNSFYSLSGEPVSKKRLAKEAIYIERELLGEVGGIQDQIWASYGGFNSISLTEQDFEVKPMPVSEEFQQEFFDRAIMIYTGKTRKSFDIAESHKNSDNVEAKHRIKELAHRAYDCFLNSDIESIAGLLHSSWLEKKKVSELVSNYEVDQMYSHLQDDGMVGGKLIGSGGSGFIFGLLDSSKNKPALKRKYQSNFIEFGVDDVGSRIING